MQVERGEVRGLIGPNGSGKTTLLNAVCGFVRLADGSVRLLGKRIDKIPPYARAEFGLGRSFQGATTFPEVTCSENVEVGRHRLDRQSFWKSMVPGVGGAIHRRELKNVHEELHLVGLDESANRVARSLAYGQQRMLDVARASASKPEVLLLDEPVAGLNQQEVDRMAEIVSVFRGRGFTVVLVEHHMRFVMDICDRITVLNFGRRIAEGTPSEVQTNPEVIAAYLGNTGK